jgi:hypothetical protein
MIEVNSATWEHIKQYAETRIAVLHSEAEDLNMSEADRREKMVRVAELRELVGLASPSPPPRIYTLEET